MGYFYKDQIEKAGLYLLDILDKKHQVSYDYFYDGTNEKHYHLVEAIGINDNETDETSAVEILLDIAVIELNEFGIVSITQLESKLADGELNYQIKLTDKGRNIIRNNKKIDFYSTEE
jgi:hypothetical protein